MRGIQARQHSLDTQLPASYLDSFQRQQQQAWCQALTLALQSVSVSVSGMSAATEHPLVAGRLPWHMAHLWPVQLRQSLVWPSSHAELCWGQPSGLQLDPRAQIQWAHQPGPVQMQRPGC